MLRAVKAPPGERRAAEAMGATGRQTMWTVLRVLNVAFCATVLYVFTRGDWANWPRTLLIGVVPLGLGLAIDFALRWLGRKPASPKGRSDSQGKP